MAELAVWWCEAIHTRIRIFGRKASAPGWVAARPCVGCGSPRHFASTVAAQLSLRKHHHTIRRNHDRRGRRKSVQCPAVGKNAAAIADDLRIDPMVVDVAVESLFPEAAGRKSQPVACPCRFRKRRNHDDVIATALAPAMIGNHPVTVGLIEGVDVVTPQRRQIAPKPDELSRETQVIPHGGIRWCVKAIPRQQVWPARIDVPGLILEKLL